MDIAIPKDKIARRRRGRVLAAVAAVAAFAVAIWGITALAQPALSASSVRFGVADRGRLATSIAATGRVAPAFEQIINSPIASRIVEVYCQAGDSVAAGTPLLRLDLHTAEAELRRLTDEHAIKEHSARQGAMAASTAASNLQMQIRVKQMMVNQLREDVRNEQRLDSIGSGTGERIRQAQLAYDTAVLELEQLRQQLANEQQAQQAQDAMRQLELGISASNIQQMRRTVDDASLKAPRAATLTYIVSEIGRQVGAGEKVAVIADLGHFKVDGQVADSYASRLCVGSRAVVQVGRERLMGTVANIAPQSQGGVINFSVVLDDDSNPGLRAGTSTQVHVLADVKEDVVRIPNGAYYAGPGPYAMFVRRGDRLERRKVRLGQSSYDYVEVVSGLEPGDEVAVSDLGDYSSKNHIKLK